MPCARPVAWSNAAIRCAQIPQTRPLMTAGLRTKGATPPARISFDKQRGNKGYVRYEAPLAARAGVDVQTVVLEMLELNVEYWSVSPGTHLLR
jgi:hypothetical protein